MPGAAFDEIAPEPLRFFGRECAAARQLGILLVVAGEQRELDAARAGDLDQPLDAVIPIAASAENARDDQFRVAPDILYIEIYRIVVTELEQAREAQAWRRLIACNKTLLCCCKTSEIAIRRGEHDDRARRLAEIDRLRAI